MAPASRRNDSSAQARLFAVIISNHRWPRFGETSSMRTFGLKVLIVVVVALVGTAVIHSLVYLSIDPGILSAQMPR
jgi:hypothetical protein